MKMPKLPRWAGLAVLILAVILLITGLVWFIIKFPFIGTVTTVVIAVILFFMLRSTIPMLLKWYRFNKYYKKNEGMLSGLPGLVESGKTQEALSRFEGVMKHAPDNAYTWFIRSYFLQSAGKLPEALAAANKAYAMADKDPMLAQMLKEAGGQMGQPTTVKEFKTKLEELQDSLSPRVTEMRVRREKAVAKRKKKSR